MATVSAETRGAVGLARLDRPDARNALSAELMEELASLCERWDEDPEIRCIVIAGGDKWFAAAPTSRRWRSGRSRRLTSPSARFWPRLGALRTPVVAAVSGYALGGGCELALACDMIVASESAEFGQPEILLGIIPGGGGTQRLARVMGKQRAMELVLTGRRIAATEAHELGIVTRLAPDDGWLDAALELAAEVAERPPLAARLAKQAVLAAEETGAVRGARPGAAALRAGDGHRGPRRGDERVHREAQAGVPRPVTILGVVGAGTMGAGIAQLGAAAGMRTLLHDPVPEALERGTEGARRGLAKWAEKGGSVRRPPLARSRLVARRARPVRPRHRGGARAPELKRDLFGALRWCAATMWCSRRTHRRYPSHRWRARQHGPRTVMHFFNLPHSCLSWR